MAGETLERYTSNEQRYLQVNDGISAHPLHGVQLQIALEVPGVEPGDGQTVAESSLARRGGKGFYCSNNAGTNVFDNDE